MVRPKEWWQQKQREVRKGFEVDKKFKDTAEGKGNDDGKEQSKLESYC